MKKAILFLIMIIMLTSCGNKKDDFTMEKDGSIPLGEGYINTYRINRSDKNTAGKEDKGSYFLFDELIDCGYIPKVSDEGDTNKIELEYRNIPSKMREINFTLPKDARIIMNGKELKTLEYNGQIFVLADVLLEMAQADKSDITVNPNSGEAFTNKARDLDKTVIFLDPGHGVDSSAMTDEQKSAEGWTQNNGKWGEWRHWSNGEYGSDCNGNDGKSQPKECWYPIENGDRSTEPDINLSICKAAKQFLEETGKYTVILSRDENNSASLENPSITKRIENAAAENAATYVCIHSNAGGGSGSAYIALNEANGYYAMNRDENYASNSNRLGKIINDKIVSDTGLNAYSNGRIDNEEYLILFQKAPMLCAYLEIGFYDNGADLSILKNDCDAIGKAVAGGITEYFSE